MLVMAREARLEPEIRCGAEKPTTATRCLTVLANVANAPSDTTAANNGIARTI